VAAYSSGGAHPRRASFLALVVATAVLYLARDVLIPLAMAILLAFLLAPAVRRLERLKLGRLASTLIVAFIGFGIVFGVAAIAATQGVSLAAKLPEYRHNIAAKIHALRHPNETTTIGKAAEALKDIEKQAAPERPPLPVKETPASSFEALAQFLAPVTKPLAMTLATVVFTILMLLNRESMRERVIGLIGTGRINAMTKAMSEASYRVSRYLGTQVVVNTMFGVPFGLALYFIGVPNALLFGLLGLVLRFIPYAGVWIAGAMPAILAFAISDSWTPVLWTAGVFVALEGVLAYVIEPWLYGRSAGLSPIAIIAAVIFWTWLWGPVGLLLATPLTVCVAVIGRHIPELGYLNVLLDVEPVLSPEQRLYQRLVALDHEEAAEIVENHVAAQGVASAFDELIVPALALAEHEQRRGTLEPARQRFVYDHLRRMVDELEQVPRAPGAPAVCLVGAHGDADEIAAHMLARLLAHAHVLGVGASAAEVAQAAAQRRCKAIVICAVAPHGAHYAGYLARRLRRQMPDARIAVGLWSGAEDVAPDRQRLLKLGADAVVARLGEAAQALKQLAEKSQAANEEAAKHSVRR
jgi:predicted PurR-regulated permease PerM/methylmalonyl-CoA mutase cobalamin-binding subunit